ncbi:MAG: universal stress protein, partial [Pirellulaceae bacterium]|nr:universal stress protein [Pirellulaceae bacterium]
PTDFSDCSERARTYACELAKRFTAELHLLHVVVPLPIPVHMSTVPEELLEPEESARQALESWNDPAYEAARKVVRTIVTGTPFIEIVRYARENQIDLIVVGTHGRSGLMHSLIGSVAERVVRKASCPVLTVRPEGHQFVMP